MRRGHEACRHRSGRSAGRTAGRATELPRVVCRAECLRLAGADGGELGSVGAPEWDQAGGAKGKCQRGIGRGTESDVAQRAHAHGVGLAGLATAIVLEQERHAPERTVGQRTLCIVAGAFVLTVHHDVELRIEPLDPFDGFVNQLARMHLAGPYQLCLRRGVEVNGGNVHH